MRWLKIPPTGAFRDRYLYISGLAFVVGIVSAAGAVLFYEAIQFFQYFFFGLWGKVTGSNNELLLKVGIVLAPMLGGLVVGLLIQFCTKKGKADGVAEVIEASAVNKGRMDIRDGVVSAIASAISIGSGSSVGREGPVVQLGAVLASKVSEILKLDSSQCRVLLGAGAASAIAASFNAPFAGVFFAHEVIIGHYALTAFAPVSVAAVVGTVISRVYFGDFPAFLISSHEIKSFFELPAFALLGMICALFAIIFIRSVPVISKIKSNFNFPQWVMPAVGGLIIGLLALKFPEVMGVGYEATNKALNGDYNLKILISLLIAKLIATIVSLSFGAVGGVFSPSLFMGAMLGGAFGILVAWPFPELASSTSSYSMAGMGAFAAAVLGAPISTTIMIFELTGDYRLTLSVLVAVVAATLTTRSFHGPSYFLWMLASRGVVLSGGHELATLEKPDIKSLMRSDQTVLNAGATLSELRLKLLTAVNAEVFVEDKGVFMGRLVLSDLGGLAFTDKFDEDKTIANLISVSELYVCKEDSLDKAAELFSQEGIAASIEDSLLAVLDSPDSKKIVGCLHERDVMRAQLDYVRRLERLREEEH